MNNFFKKHWTGAAGIGEMLQIAVPLMISQGSASLMMFTDRYLLSALGPAFPGASMSGSFVATIFSVLFIGMVSYLTALVGQYLGAGEEKKCTVVFWQAILLCLVASPLIMLAGHFLAPIYFAWVGSPTEELELANQYFSIMNYGALIILINVAFSSFFSGLGLTNRVMAINVFGMLINIPISYSLIHQSSFPAVQGMRGAALGSILSALLMISIYVALILKPKFRRYYGVLQALRFDRDIFVKLIRFGGPTGLEIFLTFFVFTTFMSFFHSYGLNSSLAMTIVFNWDIVAFLPIYGINIGIMSLVGQYMGAQNVEAAVRATYSGAKIAFTLALCYALIFIFGSDFLVRFLMPNHMSSQDYIVVHTMSCSMLLFGAVYCWGNTVNLVFSATLRAAGDTKFCLYTSLLGEWSMLVATYISINTFRSSPLATWGIYVGFIMVIGAIFAARFYQGKWKKIQVVSVQPSPLTCNFGTPSKV